MKNFLFRNDFSMKKYMHLKFMSFFYIFLIFCFFWNFLRFLPFKILIRIFRKFFFFLNQKFNLIVTVDMALISRLISLQKI